MLTLPLIGALPPFPVLDENVCARLVADLEDDPGGLTAPLEPDNAGRAHDPQFARSFTRLADEDQQQRIVDALIPHLETAEGFLDVEGLEVAPELHLLTYLTGGFIRPHVDLAADHPLASVRERVAVFSIPLNDGYEGGEFILLPLPGVAIEVWQQPGSLILFRADLAHRVREIRSGTRHSVTGWLRRAWAGEG